MFLVGNLEPLQVLVVQESKIFFKKGSSSVTLLIISSFSSPFIAGFGLDPVSLGTEVLSLSSFTSVRLQSRHLYKEIRLYIYTHRIH